MLLGVLALLGVAAIGHDVALPRPVWRADRDNGALISQASPFDVRPDVMLDQVAFSRMPAPVTAALVFVYKLVTVKRWLEDAGVKG